MNCNRTTIVQKTWINDWTGEPEMEYEAVPECNFVDTSLHSYKCTVCGEKFWYSTRGRISEQLGVPLEEVKADGTLHTKTS